MGSSFFLIYLNIIPASRVHCISMSLFPLSKHRSLVVSVAELLSDGIRKSLIFLRAYSKSLACQFPESFVDSLAVG